jgi:HlyD family secretion protein
VTDVQLSFRIPGWVQKRLVDEGEVVKVGQEIAQLDRSELAQEAELHDAEVQAVKAALAELEAGSRPEEIAQAEAAVLKAQALLDEVVTGSRPEEIAGAEATLQAAKIETDQFKLDFDRVAKLYQSGTTSQQDYDRAKAAYDGASQRRREAEERLKLVKLGPRKEQVDQARAALKQAQATLDLVRKGPRQEQIDQSRARLLQTQQTLAIAKTHLGYTTLVSPLAGVVLSKNVETGEYVVAGTPIVTVADLSDIWLRAYISEPDLGRVKLGQKVRVTADTYPGQVYEGHISFISSEAEFTPKNVETQKERVKLVFRLKIAVANRSSELKPGMPADAEIRIGP